MIRQSDRFPGVLGLAAVAIAVSLGGCGGSSSGRNNTVAPLVIQTLTLPDGVQGSSYSATLDASGGIVPYTWSLTSGSLPTGLALSPAGVVSGTPGASGPFSFTVQVSDGRSPPETATGSISLTIQPPLAVVTLGLPDGFNGSSYSTTLAASGGIQPYAWTLDSGLLPNGLSLAASGVISGTPTTPGPFSFSVRVTDSHTPSGTATRALDILVLPGLAVVTSSLPDAVEGVPYSLPLSATGGLLPYSWGIVAGSPPAGITLDPAGLLFGTPTAIGIVSFTVEVTDSQAPPASATAALDLTVRPRPFSILTASLPDGEVGTAYSETLQASGGQAPYTWIITSGALPPNLSLGTGGDITGTPNTNGLFTFEVEATDSQPVPALATASLVLAVFTAPASNTPPTSTACSITGIQRGLVDFCYTVTDAEDDPVYVTFHYSTDGGAVFLSATEGPGGEGLGPLPASSAGTEHLFIWDSEVDGVGISAPEMNVILRVGANDSENGPFSESGTFGVDNTPGGSRFIPSNSMQEARMKHTATLLNDGTVLIAGGEGINQTIHQNAEIFSPVTGKFTLLASLMTTPRRDHTATLLPDGTVLLAGGVPSLLGTELDSAEIFDPVTQTFQVTSGALSTRRKWHAAAVAGGVAYVTGGHQDPATILDQAEGYDILGGTFNLITGRFRAPRAHHTATTLANGRILLGAGGDKTSGTDIDLSAEEFDPVTGTSPVWDQIPSAIETIEHRSSVLQDGTVLITGGGPSWGVISLANSFDQANLWTPGVGFTWQGQMGKTRRRHTSTTVPDGRVVIAGGEESMTFIIMPDAEVFDPVGRTFNVTSPMTIGRSWHRAVLLQDGRVLITGGLSTGGDPVVDTERFHP